MAKIRFGALAAEVRGSISGVTFSRNKGGAYVRNRTVPIDPSTALQTASRVTFRDAVSAWVDALSVNDRIYWAAYAATVPYTDIYGEPRYYTGQQRFIQAYASLIPLGVPLATFGPGPSIFELPMLPELHELQPGIITDGDPLTVTFAGASQLTSPPGPVDAPAGTPVGTILQYRVAGLLSPGGASVKVPFRNAGYVAAVDNDGVEWPLLTVPNPWGLQWTDEQESAVYGMRALTPDGRVTSWVDAMITPKEWSFE